MTTDERIQELCRFIETHRDQTHTLESLSARAALSPFHLQRRFKAATGVTPKQYAEACRMRQLKASLRSAGDVTEAVYAAGFGSSSRVYERADTRLGMTPRQYRRGGEAVEITYASAETAVGWMMMGATDRGLCFVQFADDAQALLDLLRREYPAAVLTPMAQPPHPDFVRWLENLQAHLAGTQPALELPLDIQATAFQMRVWSYLQSIPYGEVASYGEVAAALGAPSASRAVARACASNRVALVIPCHRVIRGTGEMGGYRWGIARKRTMLDRERAARAR
ncbi:MAG: methylated-DNA--[protein]-cysteine S-methyltransferase [Bryobacteraceae bacterium]|nr:methylated-DNA--[protein]-cysteine S-methyltransferase [Bryobacteraceae bacterium]